MYWVNFIGRRKTFCISLYYNGENSCLFVNGTEIIKFKAKDSEIVAAPLCRGNISKDWSVGNIKGLDLMVMSIISVLIMILFQFMIF